MNSATVRTFTLTQVFELASPLSYAVDDVEDQDWVKTVQVPWRYLFT